MTAAVVLAAGVGRRLAGVADVPKWLLPVRDGTPSCPAESQLQALSSSETIESVYVVVGTQVAPIQRAVDRWAADVSVELVENPHATTRNNWYSLLLGLDRVLAQGHGEVAVLNSDVYAGAAWIADSLTRCRRSEGAALVIDPAKGKTDEAMKVSVHGDRIERIGKVGVDVPAGEYVGLSWWSAASATEYVGHLRRYLDDPACSDNWYEHAIDDHLRAGGDYRLVAPPDSTWVEIDDAADLEVARRLPV